MDDRLTGPEDEEQTDQIDYVFCVTCRVEEDPQNMITPCACADAKYWHYECLARWIMHSRDRPCPVCTHGKYTDPRIRREPRAGRLNYLIDQPRENLSILSISAVLSHGLCLLFYYKFQNIWNSVSRDDTFNDIFSVEFFQMVTPLIVAIPLVGIITFFLLGLNDAYREWYRFREVIHFDDFDGQTEVAGATYQYELGEVRRQRVIQQQIQEEQQQNQNQLEIQEFEPNELDD